MRWDYALLQLQLHEHEAALEQQLPQVLLTWSAFTLPNLPERASPNLTYFRLVHFDLITTDKYDGIMPLLHIHLHACKVASEHQLQQVLPTSPSPFLPHQKNYTT